MSKTVNTRIQNKIDTSANWAKATNFTPLKGEIIIYSDLKKIKIGDGTTKVTALPFLTDNDTIPANGKLTIQKNGTAVATFTANQSGDTTANITVPTKLTDLSDRAFSQISSRGEAFLEWGGPSKSGSISPIGMALSSEHSANRVALISPNALTFEYSSDGGTTWTAYSYTGNTKTQFCTTSLSLPIGRPNGSTNLVANKSKTRITITAQDGTHGYVYTSLKKMLMNVSSATTLSMLIETRTGVNYKNNGAWSSVGTYNLSGWSGWNDIPLNVRLGGGNTQTSNNWQMRLTITCTTVSSSYPKTGEVLGIRLFGDNCWTPPSTLAETGNIYTFDMNSNVVFPGTLSIKAGTSTSYPVLAAGQTNTFTGTSAFNSGIIHLGQGDNNALDLGSNGRLNSGNQTLLGMMSGAFTLGHGNYNTNIRGKATRLTYNSKDLALKEDITTTLLGGTVSVTGTYKKATGIGTGTGTANYTPSGSVSLGSNTTSTNGTQYVENVSGLSVDKTTKYLHKSTANFVTGVAANGTATAVTGINQTAKYLKGSFTGTQATGSVSLTAKGSVSLTNGTAPSLTIATTTSDGATQFVKSISSTAASASGTGTFIKEINGGTGSLTTNSTASGGIGYIASLSTKSITPAGKVNATLSGSTLVVSFAGDSISGIVSGGTTSYLHHTHTGASSKSTGTAVTGVTGGTTTATLNYMKFAAGTTPKSSATFTGSAATGSVTLTPTGSISLTTSTATSTGAIKYLEAASASGTSTVLTGVKASGTASAINGLTVSTTSQTGDITYVENVGDVSATVSKKYFHPTFTGTGVNLTVTTTDTTITSTGTFTPGN